MAVYLSSNNVKPLLGT